MAENINIYQYYFVLKFVNMFPPWLFETVHVMLYLNWFICSISLKVPKNKLMNITKFVFTLCKQLSEIPQKSILHLKHVITFL